MRCRKCGREVDSRLTYCPACGVRLKADVDLEELTNEIAGKVDLFMNEEKEDHSGEKNETGYTRMSFDDDKTITGFQGEDVSVFDDMQRSLDDDELDLSGYEDDDEEEEYVRPRTSGNKKKKKNNTGLIIGIVVCALAIVAIVIACLFIFGIFGGKTEEESEETAAADVITCSVSDGGEYGAPLEITLESSTGYRMYYTLNGSSPSTSSTQYSGTITLDESYIEDDEGTEITLRVVSYTENSIKSGEIEVIFTLVYGEVSAPEISPSSGNYDEATSITITAASGAKIYYTTDGTTPTESSNLYTGSFDMERGNTVISAIAVKNGVSSSVSTAVYNLDIPSVYTFSEAKEIILEYLVNRGDAADMDGNLIGGGTVDFMDGGTCIIDNEQYIVLYCYFYDAEGNETDSCIYGVEDQTGAYYELTETSSGYTK